MHQQQQPLSLVGQDFNNNIGPDTNDGSRFPTDKHLNTNILMFDTINQNVNQFLSNQPLRHIDSDLSTSTNIYNQQQQQQQQQHQYRVKTQQHRNNHHQVQQRSQTIGVNPSSVDENSNELADDLVSSYNRNSSDSKKNEQNEPKSNNSPPSNVNNNNNSGNTKQANVNTPQQARNTSIKKLKNFFGEKVKRKKCTFTQGPN